MGWFFYKKDQAEGENPFDEMGFIRFTCLTVLFYASFPFSLIGIYCVFGKRKTVQLIRALMTDFFLTILLLGLTFLFIMWLTYIYLWPTLVSRFSAYLPFF